jgi:hypothetical protein
MTTKVAAYLAARPTEFSTVRAIEVRQHETDGEPPVTGVVLELGHRTEPNRGLRLAFKGVTGLNIRQPNTSLFQITFLEIRDCSLEQWEGVRFVVQDVEEGSLSLRCSDFEQELI